MKHLPGLSLLLALLALAACDSPAGLTVRPLKAETLRLRANLQPASLTQAALVTLLDPRVLPAALRTATQLEVVFDTSRTRITVTRNPDGTLSFPFRSSRPLGSDGSFSVLLIGDRTTSVPVQIETGPELSFESPAVEVLPARTVTQGSRLTLKARLKQPEKASDYDFTWFWSPAAAGPWQSMSGSGSTVEWDSARTGTYYLRIEMRQRLTQAVSVYTSPAALIQVLDSDRLATTEPASGSILEGEALTLSAQLPEYEGRSGLRYFWSYGLSPTGVFTPIAAEGARIRWEPPRAGNYYLRIQVSAEGSNATLTSSRALVQVLPADSAMATEPASGSLIRGESVSLRSLLPATPGLSYSWFYGFNPQASFTPIPGNGPQLNWTPGVTGDLYLRLRTVDAAGTARSYTSSKALLSVRDSDAAFTTTPARASLLRGESVSVRLNEQASANTIWSYGSGAQGPFLPIAATGTEILWTPPTPGSFYLRAESPRPDGSLATWVSATSLVTVSERSDAIVTEPALANLQLGQAVTLRSPVNIRNGRYSWFYATAANGPFVPVPSLESGALSAVTWYPTQSGSYYIRLEISDPERQSSVSFVSEQPLVQVLERQPFFSTDLSGGRMLTTDNVLLATRFESQGRAFNYGWAYSRSVAGPFTPMGGSTAPQFFWDAATKPEGSYYVRFSATPTGSDRGLTYISPVPLLFISSSDAATPEFGLNRPLTP
jgi:hypothetical protein